MNKEILFERLCALWEWYHSEREEVISYCPTRGRIPTDKPLAVLYRELVDTIAAELSV